MRRWYQDLSAREYLLKAMGMSCGAAPAFHVSTGFDTPVIYGGKQPVTCRLKLVHNMRRLRFIQSMNHSWTEVVIKKNMLPYQNYMYNYPHSSPFLLLNFICRCLFWQLWKGCRWETNSDCIKVEYGVFTTLKEKMTTVFLPPFFSCENTWSRFAMQGCNF